MKRVLVMISTYNGAPFLKEQIDSVLHQRGVEIYINIRDDGSSDDTRNVLEQYHNYKNIEIFFGENIGYAYSFWNILLGSKEYDYYAFCDQDDVWKEDKLKKAITELEKVPQDNKFYCSSMTVVDENLEVQYINDFKKLKLSFGSSIVRQRIAGCTMVFDHTLKQYLLYCDMQKDQVKMSHDLAVYAICCLTGGVAIYRNYPDILYRRHSLAVTSYGKGMLKRVQSYLKIFNEDKNRKYKEIQYLDQCLHNYIDPKQRILMDKIINYRNSFADTLRLLFDKEIDSNVFVLNCIVKFAILFQCL